MIHFVRFKNYKSLRDIAVEFTERLTVIVGPNGCGKSTLLRGMAATATLQKNQDEFNRLRTDGIEKFVSVFSGSSDEQMSIEVGNRDQDTRQSSIQIVMHSEGDADAQDISWSCRAITESQVVSTTNGAAIRKKDFYQFLPVSSMRFDANKLAASSSTSAIPPVLSATGFGLPSVLAHLKLTDYDGFVRIQDLIRRVIPGIREIHTGREIDDGEVSETLHFDYGDYRRIPSAQMSAGTMIAIGVIVKCFTSGSSGTIFLDDIDHALHPKAQMLLVESMHAILRDRADLQIVATSHSPYILDRLSWDQVRVMAANENGTAVVAKLQDYPDFDRWKDAMSPGEFWSTFYEEWATKSKPSLQPVP